jgi:hypothetical protein
MTDEKKTGAAGMENGTGKEGSRASAAGRENRLVPERSLLPLPGLMAIALYLLLLAGTIIVGVVAGRHYPPVFLIFSAFFITASGGLLMLFRWAWALALAAAVLLAGYNLWVFSSQHQPAALVQGLLNTVFFLYLVRTEVREKLR